MAALCSLVLFSSCGKDDDGGGDASTRDNFVAVYDGAENCDGATDTYVVTITAGSDDDALVINNLYGTGVSGLTATVDGNTMEIEKQEFESYGGVSSDIEATGTLAGEVLTITFTISATGLGSETCTTVCTKQ